MPLKLAPLSCSVNVQGPQTQVLQSKRVWVSSPPLTLSRLAHLWVTQLCNPGKRQCLLQPVTGRPAFPTVTGSKKGGEENITPVLRPPHCRQLTGPAHLHSLYQDQLYCTAQVRHGTATALQSAAVRNTASSPNSWNEADRESPSPHTTSWKRSGRDSSPHSPSRQPHLCPLNQGQNR